MKALNSLAASPCYCFRAHPLSDFLRECRMLQMQLTFVLLVVSTGALHASNGSSSPGSGLHHLRIHLLIGQVNNVLISNNLGAC